MRKKILSIMLITVIMLTTIFCASSVVANTYEDIQIVLSNMLGVARDYGVFTEVFSPANHNQTLFATNILIPSDQYFSAWEETRGTLYAKHIEPGVVKLDSNVAKNIVFGQDYDRDFDTNLITMRDNGAVVDTNNCSEINSFYDINGTFLDITTTLSSIANEFEQFSVMATDGVITDFSDMNRYVIDTTNTDTQVCFVQMTLEQFNGMQSGALKITKDKEQFVVINVDNMGVNNISLTKEYYVNGVCSSQDNANVSDTIVWNLVGFSDITMGMISGTVVAPYSDITLVNTCRGRVIANSFSNISGEFHFISKIKDTPVEPQTETTPTSSVSRETETISSSETVSSTQDTTVATSESGTETTKSTETVPSTSESGTQPITVETTTVDVTKETTTVNVSSTPTTVQTIVETTRTETTKPTEVIVTTPIIIVETTTVIETTTPTVVQIEDETTTVIEIEEVTTVASENEIIKVPKTPEVAADQVVIFTGRKNYIIPLLILMFGAGISMIIAYKGLKIVK